MRNRLGRGSAPRAWRVILHHDGPTPEPAWIPLRSNDEMRWIGPIHAFKSVFGRVDHRMRGDAIESSTSASLEMEKLPWHFVVFGHLLCQPSTLLISRAAEDFGTVYAWHVGLKRFKEDQIIRVAGSFRESLELLAEPPTEVLAKYQEWVRKQRSSRQADTEERASASAYSGPEARRWLIRNCNPSPLASNHFADKAVARRFIDALYALGAVQIIIPESSIQEEDDNGPYADALVVHLHTKPKLRSALCLRCEQELRTRRLSSLEVYLNSQLADPRIDRPCHRQHHRYFPTSRTIARIAGARHPLWSFQFQVQRQRVGDAHPQTCSG